MKSSFKHFVLTRFNLKWESDDVAWNKDKNGSTVLTEEWLTHRIELFKKYCYPSIKAQSNKDFVWFIYFDTDTKKEILDDLQEYCKDANIVIKLKHSYQYFEKTYTQDILENCDADLSHIITTRIDNDDIVHKDFVKEIQNRFEAQDFMAVNFSKVLMINPESYDQIRVVYTFSNHFISLIEKVENSSIVGCFDRGDLYWDVEGQVIQVKDKPYVLELISDKNLINSFRGFPIFKPTTLSDFQINEGVYKNRLFDLNNLNIKSMGLKKYLRFIRE